MGGGRFPLASHVGLSFCLHSPFWDATLDLFTTPVDMLIGKEGAPHVAGQLSCPRRSARPCAGLTPRHRLRVHLRAFLQVARTESRQAAGDRSKLGAQPPLTLSPTPES